MGQLFAYEIVVKGVVQGVGFRPTVANVARLFNLRGWVKNTTNGVEIYAEGTKSALERFIYEIEHNPPSLSMVISVDVASVKRIDSPMYSEFQILSSEKRSDVIALIPPDVSICDECLRELFDPIDRRYRYPFINCTHCGPRFTIIKSLPYDRYNTTMSGFKMCNDCLEEYNDPSDRRYHAQPNACAVCGPTVWLADKDGDKISTEDPIREAARLLKEGNIVAVKGLGGFHLVVDATIDSAVKRLRVRKHRPYKPFALMSPDISKIKAFAEVNAFEERELTSPVRPIVLLKKKESSVISEEVAPFNNYVGVMLPYTPLHYLLLDDFVAVVATSGNRQDEPLSKENDEALDRLRDIADYYLFHNRPIYVRIDDSVLYVHRHRYYFFRRARGFVPLPFVMKDELPSILACGAEEKATFSISKANYVFLSQYLGDVKYLDAYENYISVEEHFEHLFDIRPEVVVYDMHPAYNSTRYAMKYPVSRKIPVQHHFAHFLSCLGDNRFEGRAIGVIMDGTGYGTDGNIWGAEFFVGDYTGFERMGHFEYIPMVGGDVSVREPWKVALGYLWRYLGDEFYKEVGVENILMEGWELVLHALRKRVNVVEVSSCGRLFSGVSALLGIVKNNTFSAQDAMWLEYMASDGRLSSFYDFDIYEDKGVWVVGFSEMWRQILRDKVDGIDTPDIALKFHSTLVEVIVEVVSRIRRATSIDTVALSGGVFQNRILLEFLSERLKRQGFQVLIHHKVPTNDEGVSFGQILAAFGTLSLPIRFM